MLIHWVTDARINIDRQEYQVESTVNDKLPVPVLLGNDLPLLDLLIRGLSDERLNAYTWEKKGETFAMTTRSQAKEQQDTENQQTLEEEVAQGTATSLKAKSAMEIIEDTSGQKDRDKVDPGFNFGYDLLPTPRTTRKRLTKSQKRSQSQQWTQRTTDDLTSGL